MKTEVDHILMVITYNVIYWGPFEIPMPVLYINLHMPDHILCGGFVLN